MSDYFHESWALTGLLEATVGLECTAGRLDHATISAMCEQLYAQILGWAL